MAEIAIISGFIIFRLQFVNKQECLPAFNGTQEPGVDKSCPVQRLICDTVDWTQTAPAVFGAQPKVTR
jgi:hypothetical protein